MNLDASPLPLLRELPAPNEPIPLAKGRMSIVFPRRAIRVECDVTAVLMWQPHPCPTFTTTIETTSREPLDEVYATLTTDGKEVECLISSRRTTWMPGGGQSCALTLRLRDTIDFGDGIGLVRIFFGIVNLSDFLGTFISDGDGGWAGRLVFEASGWRVTIDERRDLREIVELLETAGGFAVTHAVCLERSDGMPFEASAASEIIDALFILLSFARGRNVSFVLYRGETQSQSRAWWRWLVPSVDSWADRESWFDTQRPHQLNPMFARLVARWSDLGWRKAMQLAVYWYVLALQNSSTSDSAIVLAFTGLDLVAWFWLVELESTFPAKEFDGKDAAERLRCLLQRVGVRLAIPSSLSSLAAHAAQESWSDGPSALAVLRNSVVHPRRRTRAFDAPDPVRWEASSLALWYLELVLLAALGHSGTHVNRTNRAENFGLEYVPWATEYAAD